VVVPRQGFQTRRGERLLHLAGQLDQQGRRPWVDQQAQGQQGGAEIAPQAGVVDNGLAYGVVINGYQPQQANSLDQAVQELVQGMSQDNPGLRANGSPQRVRVNGVEGRSLDLTGNSPLSDNGKPARERDWLVALPRQDGSLFYCVFVAPDRDFNALRPTFERMLKSLQIQ